LSFASRAKRLMKPNLNLSRVDPKRAVLSKEAHDLKRKNGFATRKMKRYMHANVDMACSQIILRHALPDPLRMILQ